MIRLPKIKTADSVHVYIQEFAKCHQTLFHVLRVGLVRVVCLCRGEGERGGMTCVIELLQASKPAC